MDGWDGYEDDEPDGLVQSTFTIPCGSSSRIEQHDARDFPILSKYEQNAGPSRLRRKGFNVARKQAVRAFENTSSSIYDPVIAEIESFCVNQHTNISQYFIPGSSSDDIAKRLSVASLIGTQVSQSFYDRLKDRLKKKKGFRWVALQLRECVSLAATARILAANLIDPSTSLDLDATGFSSLSTLSSSTTTVIYLRSIALHKYTVLNDLIKALHSAAQVPDHPRVILLLGVEGGFGSLDDKVDSESMRLMDMHRISMPSPTKAFETFVHELVLVADVKSSLWLGSSVLELLRYQYYERGFDLDRMVTTVELAIHHHFTTRPLSAIFTLPAAGYDSSDWHAVFFDRLRLHIVEAGGQDRVNLPRPANDTVMSKQVYLRSLLTDDTALLESMSDFALACAHYRTNLQRAIYLLHTLRPHFLNQASNNDAEDSLLEPRKATLGGLAWHILSGQEVIKLINTVISAIKKATMKQLKESLQEVLSYDWSLEDEVFKQRMTAFLGEVQVEVSKEVQEETEMELDHSEKQRLEMVQRRLLREESSDAVKRKVADWIRGILDSWINCRPVLTQVYSYDFSSYLTQLCDPTPRGSILAALNDPSSSSISISGKEDVGINIPDICRLYQVYQSAGKMINLSDLYQAFSQAIKSNHSTLPSGQKGHLNGDTSDPMQRKDAVQARFALAINELGKMGFMKKTRRKPDHVLKIVHDLPSGL